MRLVYLLGLNISLNKRFETKKLILFGFGSNVFFKQSNRGANMFNFITETRFDQKSTRILWVESFIFAVIFGLMFKTWVVWGVLFLGSAVLLSKPNTAVYTIFVVCALWTFIFAALGYGIGGWIGAIVVGATVFYKGVRLHLRELKRLPDQSNFAVNDWRQNWYLGRQNLN